MNSYKSGTRKISSSYSFCSDYCVLFKVFDTIRGVCVKYLIVHYCKTSITERLNSKSYI